MGTPGSRGSPEPTEPDAGPWRALVAAPPWPRGALDVAEAAGTALAFAVVAERDGVAELRLEGPGLGAAQVLETLARAGFPALGDAARGGIDVAGGVRLAAADVPPPPAWWPDAPVFAPERPPPALRISDASRRAIDAGHPWVLHDAETGSLQRLRPGALVELVVARAGRGRRRPCGLARVDGAGDVAARMWSRDARHPREATSVEARVVRAVERRVALLAAARRPDGSDVFRLLHGEADGLPGLHVDRLGPLLRVLQTGRACEPLVDRVLDALAGPLAGDLGPDPPVVQVTHLRSRPAGRLQCVRLLRGSLPGPPGACASDGRAAGSAWRDGRLVVRERGLRFLVDPGLSEPERPRPGTGLFLDQRENRERLAQRARALRGRGPWVNLFAHTGAFSVALLAAGADEVVSVDLSAPYLEWLQRNLEENGMGGGASGRHRVERGDGRRFFERLPRAARFAGIVIDPPTAAAAGRRFWSVRRDLEPLLAQAFAHLVPGGVLFVARNDRGAARGLAPAIAAAAARAGVRLERVQDAPPGRDFPRLPGFPEGDAFHARIAVRADPD